MADQDFNIKVVTTADTTGLRQTRTEMEALRQQAEKIKQDAGAKALFDRVPPKVPTPTTPEEPAEKAGTSLTRAFTAAAGFGYLVARVINGIAEETNKVTAELDKQGDHLVDLSGKWADMAKAATSSEDVSKIAASGVKEIDNLTKAINKAASADQTFGQQFVDTLVKVFKNTKDAIGPNEELADNLTKGLVQTKQEMIEVNAHAIELGRTMQASFEKRQAESLADALADVADEMAKAKNEQDALTGAMLRTQAGIQRYNELSVILANLTRQTDLLTQADARRQRQAEEADKAAAKKAAAEASFMSGAIGSSSAQTQAVIRNEAAAQKARESGHEHEADLYQKTADQLEKSMTPEQRDELEGLRKATTKPVGRTAGIGESQDLVDQIERNRINDDRVKRGEPPLADKGKDSGLVDAFQQALDRSMDKYWGR